ncbi:MAG: MASE1 domain-containing protein [Verrucomicrobia bacterium]|nr:MASE1 domain-containing protein [Verrucomicrobiota bacterium]
MAEPDHQPGDGPATQVRALLQNRVAQNVLAGGVCLVTAVAGHHISDWPKAESLAWPSFGLAVAGVVLAGWRLWPGLFLGIILGHVIAGQPWLLAGGKAASDVAGALVAYGLFLRLGRLERSLERVCDVLSLFYFGAVAGAVCSASLSVLAMVLTLKTPAESWAWRWFMEWLPRSLAVVTVTPLVLTWAGRGWRPRTDARLKEAVCLLALLCGAGMLVFGERFPSELAKYSVAYVVFIFALWSALRFGPRGAAMTVFIVALLSLLGAERECGPFAAQSPEDVVLLWSVFNGAFSVSTLVLAAVIAERRRGETALQTSEARYHHLFSQAPISIWEEDFSALVRWLAELRARGVADLRDYLVRHPEEVDRAISLVRVRDTNDAAMRMFEAENREQLVGELGGTIKPGSRQFFVQELLQIWEGATRYEGEVEGRTFKGKRINYIVHWDVSTGEGRTDWAHVIVAITDITERSRLREEVRQAQKMEAVGRLAGGIAHDFNNLIMTIHGYSSLLLARPGDDPSRREEAEQIKLAAERAADLTRQLLAFSRKQVMRPRVLDLNAVVSDMNKMLCRLIGEHIQLEKRLAADLGTVKADPNQLEQVILNLAVNARDAMPGGGRLTLATSNVEVAPPGTQTQTGVLAPGRYVQLTVTDTGCGLSLEAKAHLFEPFFTTKSAEQGTGLGLSTVYGIIKQSGGEIAVTSEEALGTIIQIYLPRAEETDTEVLRAQQAAQFPRGNETVLVAEDEDHVRNLLCKCLGTFGYKVLSGASGVEALAVAGCVDRIDVLLTDLVMPEMGGRELATRLLQSRPDLKIIFHSGHTGDSILREGPWEGRALFLEKPFTPQTLLVTVRSLLDGRKAAAARSAEPSTRPVA